MDCPLPCAVCGNDLAPAAVRCPFCGAEREAAVLHVPRPALRTINLEKGLPTVAQAMSRLCRELDQARVQGCRVLVLVHGYGSSGEGGAIRTEVLRQLGYLLDQGRINDFLPGDECDRRTGRGRQMAKRFPFLERYLKAPNPGISLVVL